MTSFFTRPARSSSDDDFQSMAPVGPKSRIKPNVSSLPQTPTFANSKKRKRTLNTKNASTVSSASASVKRLKKESPKSGRNGIMSFMRTQHHAVDLEVIDVDAEDNDTSLSISLVESCAVPSVDSCMLDSGYGTVNHLIVESSFAAEEKLDGRTGADNVGQSIPAPEFADPAFVHDEVPDNPHDPLSSFLAASAAIYSSQSQSQSYSQSLDGDDVDNDGIGELLAEMEHEHDDDIMSVWSEEGEVRQSDRLGDHSRVVSDSMDVDVDTPFLDPAEAPAPVENSEQVEREDPIANNLEDVQDSFDLWATQAERELVEALGLVEDSGNSFADGQDERVSPPDSTSITKAFSDHVNACVHNKSNDPVSTLRNSNISAVLDGFRYSPGQSANPTARPLSTLQSRHFHSAGESAAKTSSSVSVSAPTNSGSRNGGWGWGAWSGKGKGKRECPFYKRIPGTSFAVDAFTYGAIPGVTGYFLTHFHSDHYGGLTSTFNHGMIYCSPVTRTLVLMQLRVDESRVVALPLGEEVEVESAGSSRGGDKKGNAVKVTLMEANHCPGSVLMLFKVPNSLPNSPHYTYLHTGDMRAHPPHLQLPHLTSLPRIDALFLDTTYCRPQYRFPPQDEVIRVCSELVVGMADGRDSRKVIGDAWKEWRSRQVEATAGTGDSSEKQSNPPKPTGLLGWLRITPKESTSSVVAKPRTSGPLNAFTRLLNPPQRTLVTVGAYQIGKERLFKALALSLRTSIFAQDSHKRRVLRSIGDQQLARLIVDDPCGACVHVVGMGKVDKDGALEALEYANSRGGNFSRVIAIRPTGWTWGGGSKGGRTAKVETTGPFSVRDLRPYPAHPKVTVVPLPYSEHSSFDELEMFVSGLAKHPGLRKVVPTVGSGQGFRETQRYCDGFRAAGEAAARHVPAGSPSERDCPPLTFRDRQE
ncbi:hypothetical protein HDU93_010004 [Gonapodya sp. JEL0774]|nr:hypothetical protein HDU93_010004 [Gonapodya sp. JEL0774]